MDPSLQAEAVIGAGRGALIVAMFGAGWLGWGLGQARAFNGFVGPAFGFIELFLLACSIYVIRKGRRLRKVYPPNPHLHASSHPKIVSSRCVYGGRRALACLDPREWAPSPLPRNRLVRDGSRSPVSLLLAKIFRALHLGVTGILLTLFSVPSLLVPVSLECSRDLSHGWNGNPARGPPPSPRCFAPAKSCTLCNNRQLSVGCCRAMADNPAPVQACRKLTMICPCNDRITLVSDA